MLKRDGWRIGRVGVVVTVLAGVAVPWGPAAAKGVSLHTPAGHFNRPTVAFAAAGHVFVENQDLSIVTIDAATGAVQRYPVQAANIEVAVMGSELLVQNGPHEIDEYQVATGAPIRAIRDEALFVDGFTATDGDLVVATGVTSTRVAVVNAVTGRVLRYLAYSFGSSAISLDMDATGDDVFFDGITTANDEPVDAVLEFSLSTGKEVRAVAIRGHVTSPGPMAVTGPYLFVFDASAEGQDYVEFDAANGAYLRRLPVGGFMAADGANLYLVGGTTLSLLDLATGATLKTFQEPTFDDPAGAALEDGHLFVGEPDSNEVTMLNPSGAVLKQIR